MDEISSLDWDIVPLEEYDYNSLRKEISQVKAFLNNPNANNEGFSDLVRAFMKDILEVDAGVIVKVFSTDSYDFDSIEPKSGAPMLKPIGERTLSEIWVRDGTSFLKEIDKFGFCRGYWQYSYQIPAHPMWFNREEVIYTMEHNRSMSCYGYARTQSILDIIKSLHYSTLYNKRFFEETAIPDGALSLLDTNETEMNDFLAWWNGEFKAQPHKIAVVNKDVKWQPFASTNTELQFLETQKWYFNMVVSAFGLSLSEMGIVEDVNRANGATQSELVKRKSIRPFLKLIEEAINKGIIPEFQFEGIEFQFIYDDPAEKSMRLGNWGNELNMGVKTINEVRNEMGLEPTEGGDVSNQMFNMGNNQSYSNENSEQDGNYKDEMRVSEGKPARGELNEKSVKITSEQEREEELKIRTLNPFSDENRATGNFKSNKGTETNTDINEGKFREIASANGVSPDELITGFGIEREHSSVVENDEDKIIQIALDHLKEFPDYYTKLTAMEKSADRGLKQEIYMEMANEMYRLLIVSGVSAGRAATLVTQFKQRMRTKGVDDGQYYREQTFKPSQIDPFAQSQPVNNTSMNPSQLGSDFRRPGIDTYKEDKVSCPVCAYPTLAVTTSEITNLEEFYCSQCGARLTLQQIIDMKGLDLMEDVMTENNETEVVVKPEHSATKSCDCNNFCKGLDANMSMKEYVGFDVSKSLPFAFEYASTPEYQNLLMSLLNKGENALGVEDVGKIISVLKNNMKMGASVNTVANKINSIINDPQRSSLIARTEIVRIANEGNIKRLESYGAKKLMFMSALEDGRLCSVCKLLNGQVFKSVSAKGKIPVHPHCRCTWLDVTNKFTDASLEGMPKIDSEHKFGNEVSEGLGFSVTVGEEEILR